MIKNNIKKTNIIMMIMIIFMMSLLLTSYSIAEGMEKNGLFENQNRYELNVNKNETNQFRFKNNFQFNFKCNSSINIEIENDGFTDAGNISIELNTEEENTLRIQINRTNKNMGLEKGRILKNENMYRYRYTYMYILNISLENEDTINATLRAKVSSKNTSWAYYDDENKVFVIVDSEYEDGYIKTKTNHFSSWIVVEVLDPITLYIIIISCIIGLIGTIIIYKRTNN